MENDITIFGSSISAKITALALAKNDFSVCIIPDKGQKIEKPLSNLVTFLSIGSIKYLAELIKDYEIFDQFESISAISCSMKNQLRKNTQSIHFRDQNEILGKVIKNSFLDSCLINEIEKFDNIKMLDRLNILQIDNTVKSTKITLENSQYVNSKMLILTSAKDKDFLNELDIDFIHHDFNQEALSIIIKGQIENKKCAYQKFTIDGPLAFLPYYKNEASIIWSLNKNSQILSLNSNELKLKLAEMLNQFIEIDEIVSVEKFPLRMSYAKKIFDKNTVIMGNVAHNIHPIAGQGLNLSIRDIAQFIKLIKKQRSIGYEINNNQILEMYDQSRKFDRTAFSFGTLALDAIFSSRNKVFNYLTSKGLKFIENNDYFKKQIIKSATGQDFFKKI